MKLEEIVIESQYVDYYNQSRTRESVEYSITKQEVEDLRTWLKTSQVQFSGYQGKVFFHKDTEFPRYKFTKYSNENNKIVRRVREPDNADVVVLDTVEYLEVLKTLLNQYPKEELIVPLNKVDSVGRPIYSKVDKSTTTSQSTLLISRYDQRALSILETLIGLYNTNNKLKVVSVYDLNEVLTQQGSPIDAEVAESLKNLLQSSDDQSIKLAMEIMTNADFESSLFHIVLLCTIYGQKMRNNLYWNSTAFKSFRNNMQRLNLTIDYIMGGNTMQAVRSFLKVKNKAIFEEDIDFIKKCIKEEINSTYNLQTAGFELVNYDINLSIDPVKIIKNKSSEVESIPIN